MILPLRLSFLQHYSLAFLAWKFILVVYTLDFSNNIDDLEERQLKLKAKPVDENEERKR